MTDLARWQQNNEAHLAAGLGWLRARLASLAGEGRVGNSPAERVRHSDEHLRAMVVARAAMQAAEDASSEAAEMPPALAILSERLGLSRFEAQVLLLCAGMELDTRLAGLCARAQDDPARPHPTFGLALAALEEPAWEALAPDRPLRYWRLIEINQPGAQPLIASALRADERIVHYLKGLNTLDDRLEPLLTPMDSRAGLPAAVVLPPSQRTAAEEIAGELRQAATAGRLPAIQLTGPHAASKRLIAGQVAALLGVQPHSLSAETLPANPAELETFARLWQRETILLPLALYVDASETAPVGPQMAALKRLLARSHGIFFLDVREVIAGLSESIPAFEVAQPTAAEQYELWAGALGSFAGEAPSALAAEALAAQFNLDPATIAQAAATAQLDDTGAGGVADRLWRACRSASRPRLESLAQRLEPVATWDDLVLPADTAALLRQITGQVRQRLRVYDGWGFRAKMNRGLGISALFAGESGTGKTMAAEVLANDLRLDLYRIDLSAVVSKYIGETEKNLRRLFDAAEDGGAILFFDEADALFGKRSEVKDSHDRYANIEINYLLQRMEAYRGLAVLATNMKSALDPAFMRRLRFIVSFPFPALPERRLMWQKVFPPQAPVAGLDLDQLARLNLTGGLIHNIALNAAFMAASQQPPLITMPIVLEAIRGEMRKLDRPINGI
ncbi:MAG: ATP-binding protein [Anaerolineae bacterium]